MTESPQGTGVSLSWLAALLAALTAIGPFAIDTYLPAFPAIGASLGASALEVQQSLTAYLLPFTFMTLWHGPLSDALGRRRVVLAGLAVFGAASLVCMAAQSIHTFWLGRALQGMAAGAGMVVGRAIIRDVLQGAQALKLMSQVALMFALAPAVAPIFGGWLFAWLGWRAVFAFLALLALLLGVMCWQHLPETLPQGQRQNLHPASLSRAYLAVLSSVPFLMLTLAVGLNFGGFFNYVLSAPAFLIGHLGLDARHFGWLFIPGVAGMMGGAFLSGRLAGRVTPQTAILWGFALMLAATLVNLGVVLSLPPGVPQSVLPIALYNLGMALAMPSLTLLALDLFPLRRGLAASCQSFLQSGLTSLSAGLVVPWLGGEPPILAFAMAVHLLLGAAAFGAYRLSSR